MLDFPDLISFFSSCFKNVNPTVTSKGSGDSVETDKPYNLLGLMVETLKLIANRLLNSDPQQVELFFLEYGVEQFIDIMAGNVQKMNEMAILLYCFVQSSNNSHLRVLQKLADKLAVRHRNVLPAFLTRLLVFESESGMSTELYNFYLEHAGRGLHSSSPITRTKCITILSNLSRIRLEPILPLVRILRKQQNDEYWELKGQLLIFASNALIQFNSEREYGMGGEQIDGATNSDAVHGASTGQREESKEEQTPGISLGEAGDAT